MGGASSKQETRIEMAAKECSTSACPRLGCANTVSTWAGASAASAHLAVAHNLIDARPRPLLGRLVASRNTLPFAKRVEPLNGRRKCAERWMCTGPPERVRTVWGASEGVSCQSLIDAHPSISRSPLRAWQP